MTSLSDVQSDWVPLVTPGDPTRGCRVFTVTPAASCIFGTSTELKGLKGEPFLFEIRVKLERRVVSKAQAC